MDAASPENAAGTDGVVMGDNGFNADPFLVEALQNPRHRLTILRMELDVQRFLQNPEQQQFEFQHFPTSYLRLAAHRVANHYGLATAVLDSGADGNENRILVTKTAESRFPAVRLSEIPVAKPSENGKFERMKVSIKTRPSKGSEFGAGELEKRCGPLRSVEERKEEYERARERIFSGLPGLTCDDSSSETQVYGRNMSLNRDDKQESKNAYVEAERNLSLRESGPTSRVAVFRDIVKDRFDPDYDRRHERYIRSLPMNQNFNLPPFNFQQMPTPYYEMGFTGYNQIPSTPASLGFGPPPSSMTSPYGTTFLNQASRDAMYMQWPNAAMLYAHPYEQFMNASLQAQFCSQQPMSFDDRQNL
ncbi:PREDICTED: R3H domain-containing protein 1 [Camelina sativa]|uniref:R3H domain-containing protein 1 n=1 Tax=Camelina sativa TaxID=90675 RepID=A0ABM0YQW0_CAMSA|nr:PREDICTED: R3H domain-containing protein 1 [Camelina sativa]